MPASYKTFSFIRFWWYVLHCVALISESFFTFILNLNLNLNFTTWDGNQSICCVPLLQDIFYVQWKTIYKLIRFPLLFITPNYTVISLDKSTSLIANRLWKLSHLSHFSDSLLRRILIFPFAWTDLCFPPSVIRHGSVITSPAAQQAEWKLTERLAFSFCRLKEIRARLCHPRWLTKNNCRHSVH